MPYPNEHSCRLKDPAAFQKDSFVRLKRGNLSLIIGKLTGKSTTTTQAYRYDTKQWTEKAAKAHCDKAGGMFEAAKKAKSAEMPVNLVAEVTGEMQTADIPIAQGVDVKQLKQGDTDPLEVVVEINSGFSTRKWNYLPATVQKIAEQINSKTPNGFLGHQKAENLDSEFPDVATHWIGALYKDGKAYVRGYIDPSMAKLKRLIRSHRIKQVSIFGIPTLHTTSHGETEVVDYNLLSLDWTPKDRNGMPTRVVATSEMSTDQQQFVTAEYDHIVKKSQQTTDQKSRGGDEMTKEEIIVALQGLLATGEMKSDDLKTLVGNVDDAAAMKEVAANLNVATDQVSSEIARLKKVEQSVKATAHAALVQKILKDKIEDDTLRELVGEMLHVDEDADEKAIDAAVTDALTHDAIKKIQSEMHVDKKPAASTTQQQEHREFTKFTKASIG